MPLANLIGARVLRYYNPRVSAPPGLWAGNGRRNIIVATPMRSGTHLVMDLILNSFPAYRRTPLYINLDWCEALGSPGQADLHNAGYVIKTHFPASRRRHSPERVAELARGSLVIIVRRPVEEIRRSLGRWLEEEPGHRTLGRQIESIDSEMAEFETFWQGLSPYVISYRDLFDPDRNRQIVEDIAVLLGEDGAGAREAVVPLSNMSLVYLNKTLTRLLGRKAPRIDTTIRARR